MDENGAGGALPVPVVRPTPDLAEVASQVVRAAFGVTSLVTEILLRAVDGTREHRLPAAADGVGATAPVDVLLGTAWVVTAASGRALGTTARAVRPVVTLLVEPPLVPESVRPATLFATAARAWRREQPAAMGTVTRLSSSIVPDTTELVVRLVDVDALAAAVVQRMDLTTLATDVVEDIDLDRVVGAALQRIDVQRLVEEVVAGLDLAAVVDRIDLAGVVDESLDRIDLTSLVVKRVDLSRVVNDALDQLDLTQLVMDRVDLARVAEYVIDEIDLAGIIRESSGSIATETVRGIRRQSLDADEAVNRVVDRLLLRRRARRTQSPLPQPPPAEPPS
jgi:hypothetical protein